jgi:hypothetical protein
MYKLEFIRSGKIEERENTQKRPLIRFAKQAMKASLPECYATVTDEDGEAVFEAGGSKDGITIHVE